MGHANATIISIAGLSIATRGPLVKAIPQQSTQLASYTPVIEETRQFEDAMATRGVWTAKPTSPVNAQYLALVAGHVSRSCPWLCAAR